MIPEPEQDCKGFVWYFEDFSPLAYGRSQRDVCKGLASPQPYFAQRSGNRDLSASLSSSHASPVGSEAPSRLGSCSYKSAPVFDSKASAAIYRFFEFHFFGTSEVVSSERFGICDCFAEDGATLRDEPCAPVLEPVVGAAAQNAGKTNPRIIEPPVFWIDSAMLHWQ